MPVKKKTGKQRKDKFYQLAKDTGYRSRAAFKLIQLNRKFSFLQKSRVCLDLCAAPGGWMQVATKNMPVSSVVVGVDLFPIKPIPGCIGLVGDITEDKTKVAIEKELKTWKADVVLHDGAPNVGQNWLHDAYSQVCLTLNALKLATHFLRGGGWFVTKVFRSKDYNALMWVLKQLFKKVHSTKPTASRTESAEIFVVCQGYLAPDKLDPRFLDPKYVFEELEMEPKVRISTIMHPEKQKSKAEGYRDGDYTHHKVLKASTLVYGNAGVEALAGIAEIELDDEAIANHPKTTQEIRECCRDIKVLGRKDLRGLLAWSKAVREDLVKDTDKAEDDAAPAEDAEPVDPEEMEYDELSKQIEELTQEEEKESRRKRKQVNKERTKLQEKMNLKMVLKGDQGPVMEDETFTLGTIQSAEEVSAVLDQRPEVLAEEEEEEDDTPKEKTVSFERGAQHLDSSGRFYKDESSESEDEDSDDSDDEIEEGLGLDEEDVDKETARNTAKNAQVTSVKENKNPLLTDLDPSSKKDKRARKAEMWFDKDIFKSIENEEDEDLEVSTMAGFIRQKGGKIIGEEDSEDEEVKTPKQKPTKSTKRKAEEPEEDYDTDSDSDSDTYDVEDTVDVKKANQRKVKNQADKDGFEIVPQQKVKKVKLDEEGLAVGTMLVNGKKSRRELIDAAWNRYTFNDDKLPDWFVEDEKKFMKREAPVPKEMIQEYRQRMQEINIRPIKKVIEAKARKKRRAMRRLDKAKKKVESLMDNVDVSDKEKLRQIRQVYKKAKGSKKKDINYVVAKKGTGKNVKRPRGVKGPYKVVDPRMKKDQKKAKKQFKKQGKKGKSTLPINRANFRKMKQQQKVVARRAKLNASM